MAKPGFKGRGERGRINFICQKTWLPVFPMYVWGKVKKSFHYFLTILKIIFGWPTKIVHIKLICQIHSCHGVGQFSFIYIGKTLKKTTTPCQKNYQAEFTCKHWNMCKNKSLNIIFLCFIYLHSSLFMYPAVTLLCPFAYLLIVFMKLLGMREHSGSVVECLSLDRAPTGSSLSGITALCPWARHINPGLVLVQPRKTHPDITEKLLTGM